MKMFRLRLQLFIIFLKIGAFTFGGGFAMIPLIEREVVDRKKWICFSDMCDILAISQSFPGAVAINSATIVGYRVGGYPGAVFATLGVVLPSFIILTLIGMAFTNIMDIGAVKAALRGIGACVVSLLIAAAIRVARNAVRGIISVLVAIGALLLILWAQIHPIYAIIFGIFIGLITYGVNLLKGKKR
ncbi:MAG: chromate transporter [Actinomycetota bacterium]